MDIVVPITLDPATVTSTDASIYPDWSSGTSYTRGQRVFDASAGIDYEALINVPSGYGAPSTISSYWWRHLGSSATQSDEVDANIDTSEYPDWVSGAAVLQGERYYDKTTQHDYEALEAISSGDNIYTPGACAASWDPTFSNRWHDLGYSNAWRMFDKQSSTRTTTPGTVLTVDAQGLGAADCLILAGLQNVWGAQAVVSPADFVPDPDNTSDSLAGYYVWPDSGTSMPTLSSASTLITLSRGAGMAASGDYYYIARYIEVTAGFEYTFSIKFRVPIDVAGQQVQMRIADESNTGSPYAWYSFDPSVSFTDYSLVWGAPELLNGRLMTRHRIGIALRVPSEFAFAQFERFSFIQTDTGTSSLGSAVPDASSQTLGLSMFYSTGLNSTKAIIRADHVPVSNPRYEMSFSAKDSKETMGVGYMLVGESINVGCAEASVDMQIDDYSRKERDSTYGTVTFLQRGFSKRYAVTLRPSPGGTGYFFGGTGGISGDELVAHFARLRAVPMFFDANPDGTTNPDSRLQIYGFYSSMSASTHGTGLPALDNVRLEIEGLAE